MPRRTPKGFRPPPTPTTSHGSRPASLCSPRPLTLPRPQMSFQPHGAGDARVNPLGALHQRAITAGVVLGIREDRADGTAGGNSLSRLRNVGDRRLTQPRV